LATTSTHSACEWSPGWPDWSVSGLLARLEVLGGWVRILAAIALSILLGLPITAPPLASREQTLTACCRRDGKHHCMERADPRIEGGSAPSISRTKAKCPYFPQTMGVTVHGQMGLGADAAVFAEMIPHPAVPSQTLSNYRVSLVRSHPKRGPPTGAFS
jgi:hypothetical protein